MKDEKAPDFSLTDLHGKDWKLSDYHGRTVVLLFYPGDNTPVCTSQMCSVRDDWSKFEESGAEVVGISTDDAVSHKSFAEKYSLTLNLLADTKGKVSAMYGMKSWIPGRSARGVVVIDKNGNVSYHKVQTLSLFKPDNDDVLRAIAEAY